MKKPSFRINKSYVVVSMALFVNCKTENVVVIPDTFPVEKTLKHEVYDIPSLIDPAELMVSSNYLFLMGMKSEPIFQQYKLPELTYMKSFGTRGRGPGEFLAPSMSVAHDNKTMYIKDLGRFNRYRITEDGDLTSNGVINAPRDAIYNQFHIIDEQLLVYNMVPDIGIEKIDLSTRRSEKIEFDNAFNGENFYHPDNGTLAVNDKYIIYVYAFRKQIDIYNIDDLSLKARLVAKVYKNPRTPSEASNLYYRNVYATKQNIYAFYVNPDTDEADNKYYVEVFDFDGTPLKKYNLGISLGGTFAVSPDDGAIYSYNWQLDDKILKFDLE